MWYLAEAPALSAVACNYVPALTLLSGSTRPEKNPLSLCGGERLPPPQAFLIVFFLAQRTIERLGENKRARAGAGSERSSSAGSDGKENRFAFSLLPMTPCAPPHYYTFFARATGDEAAAAILSEKAEVQKDGGKK